MFNTIINLTEKVNTLMATLNDQECITNDLNRKLMEAVVNGGTGTGNLERAAASAAAKEETLKQDIVNAKAELANAISEFDAMVARAHAALEAADAEELVALNSFVVKKLSEKKQAKRDLAHDRAVARNLDMNRYAEKCIREQAESNAKEATEKQASEAKAKKAEKKPEEPEQAELVVDPVAQKKAEIAAVRNEVKAYIEAIGDADPEGVASAYAQLEDLKDELRKLITTEKVEEPKQAVEPIGKTTPADKAVVNKDKEVGGMKDVTNAKRMAHVLKAANLPKDVVERVINTFSVTDMRYIVFADLKSELTALKNIGEKRADVIIKALTGRIPEPLAMKKLTVEMREQMKAELREKAKGYSVRLFESDEMFRDVMDLINALNEFRYDENDPETLENAKELLKKLKSVVLVDEHFRVREKEGRNIRLNKSCLSEVLGVDYEQKTPTAKIMAVQHDVQKLFSFDWHLFGNDIDVAKEALDKFQNDIMYRLGVKGVVVVNQNGEKLYGGVSASAGHQKKETLLMADAKLIRKHSKFFWYGKTMEEFAKMVAITGAEFWKGRANIIRPWMKPFQLADGRIIGAKDILFVKDVEKLYKFMNARRIGKNNGTMYTDGPDEELVILGDGAGLGLQQLMFQGQASLAGGKLCVADATSAIPYVCKKNGITVEEFYNKEVEGIDNRMHRVGDYAIICGGGCWKFDKFFDDFDSYMAWLDEMEKSYPGISNLYLLRQAEEIEDEEKVRRLTLSLIQQWLCMTPAEQRAISKRARAGLKKDKTFRGALNKLAGLFKKDEERTEVEKLFEAAPWLLLAPQIQAYLKKSWERKRTEAASGKFRTEGQYPYITQDVVALFEVWVLGKNPDDPDLGILRGDEVSVCDVPDRREVLCIRFPANFLTAKVMVNKACKEVFKSLNGIAVLSIHSDILIVQDGDVDGDEMAVLYNRLAIRLTKRMQKLYNPPVVLFQHGSKAKKSVSKDLPDFIRKAYTALWRAKKYDSVGLYANLATNLAYLASIAEKNGDKKELDQILLMMSAASTGAILSIDQVKGNEVDKSLIDWLDKIQTWVRKRFKTIAREMGVSDDRMHTFTHFFVAKAKRKPIPADKCLLANDDNYVDSITSLILRDTGKWEGLETGTCCWNAEAAKKALLFNEYEISVAYGRITQEMLDLIDGNWFRSVPKTEIDKSADKATEIRRKVRVGELMSFKEFLVMLHGNAMAMSTKMEGRTLWEKKDEYYAICRELISKFLESDAWDNKAAKTKSYPAGYQFSMAQRKRLAVNAALRCALELEGQDNGMGESKGDFAMFVVSLFAPAIRKNVERNAVDYDGFTGLGIDVDALMADIDEESNKDDAELFELPPSCEDEIIPDDGDESFEMSDEDALELDDPDDIPDDIPECTIDDMDNMCDIEEAC